MSSAANLFADDRSDAGSQVQNGGKARAALDRHVEEHRRSHWPEKTDSILARPRLNTLSFLREYTSADLWDSFNGHARQNRVFKERHC